LLTIAPSGAFFCEKKMTEDVTEQELDAEIGERIARGNAEKHAENKLWELEGYRLFASNF